MLQQQLQLPKIEYEDSGTWHALPDWAINLVQLGAALRNAKIPSDEHLFVALALPVSDWAAAFLTLGYILAAHKENGSGKPGDRHIQRLMQIPCETPVKLLHNGLHYDALVAERKESSVMILFTKKENMTGRVKSRKTYFECTPENCHRVRLMDEDDFDGVRDRGRRLADSPDFVSALLHGGDLVTHCVGLRTEYIIFGDLGRLREEAETTFRSGEAKGQLQDVLRIDRFSRPTQNFCGRLIPGASKPQEIENDPDTGLLVYDSAASLLRHARAAAAPVSVAVLDRSERHFADAATAIAARYRARLPGSPPSLALEFAEGIETIAFLERRTK